MVPTRSHGIPRVPCYSGYCLSTRPFTYGAFTLSGRSFQDRSTFGLSLILQSEPHRACSMVWALPRSLAATYGITFVFSSSGYLDVSVHRVPLRTLWIHARIHASSMCVPAFRHPRVTGYVLLTVAFRSLSRLSSALSAKASALRPT